MSLPFFFSFSKHIISFFRCSFIWIRNEIVLHVNASSLSFPFSAYHFPPTKTLPITYPFCSPGMVRPSIGGHQSLSYPLGQGLDPPLCVLAQGVFLCVEWAPKVHTHARVKYWSTTGGLVISEVSSLKPLFLGSGSVPCLSLIHIWRCRRAI